MANFSTNYKIYKNKKISQKITKFIKMGNFQKKYNLFKWQIGKFLKLSYKIYKNGKFSKKLQNLYKWQIFKKNYNFV